MTHGRIVISIGGNAFEQPGRPLTMAGQFDVARRTLTQLRPLLTGADAVVITHGNGPQVGSLLRRSDLALGSAYAVPLEVCVAESEGELGYVLTQTLYNVLAGVQPPPRIAALLTLVEVDPQDAAFATPTKPIGAVLNTEEAEALRGRGIALVLDAARGWRRVVPSPQPQRILGIEVIEALLADGTIVIASGGGGIPVRRQRDPTDGTAHIEGVAAVVDKDYTAALLADAIAARLLLLVTAVPNVFADFGTPQQRPLQRLASAQARLLAGAGQFPAGTMGPKIEAALRFVCGGPTDQHRRALICAPDNLTQALAGTAGTWIDR